VAQVQVQGQAKFAVRVQLDPNMLVNRGIGLDDVQNALGAHNANLPTGTLYGAHQAYTVQADGQLNDAAAYRPIIVAYRNGSPVRLGDLGKVIDSIENDKNIGQQCRSGHPDIGQGAQSDQANSRLLFRHPRLARLPCTGPV